MTSLFFKIPQLEKQVVEQQVNEWLEKRTFSPSKSNFASPIVMVKKKENTYRLCIDYRK